MKKTFFVKYSGLIIPLLFLLGFLTGVVWIVLGRDLWLTAVNSLEPGFLWKIEQIEVDKRALFFLTLWKRLRALFLLWLLSYSLLRTPVTLGFFFINGSFVGAVMELLIMKYGFKGLTFYLGLIFPQVLFYIPGYLLFGLFCLKRRRIQATGEERKKKDYSAGIGFLAVLFGIFLESYVNSEVLKVMVRFLLS